MVTAFQGGQGLSDCNKQAIGGHRFGIQIEFWRQSIRLVNFLVVRLSS